MNKAKFSNRKTLNNAPTESVMVDIKAQRPMFFLASLTILAIRKILSIRAI